MPVRAHAKQDEVEAREGDGVLAGELRHELLLVLVRDLFQVVELRGVDGVDLLARDAGSRDLGEQALVDNSVVGVLVIERDDAFVGEEDLPVRGVRWSSTESEQTRRRTTCPTGRPTS
jgi:hypothetical protein